MPWAWCDKDKLWGPDKTKLKVYFFKPQRVLCGNAPLNGKEIFEWVKEWNGKELEFPRIPKFEYTNSHIRVRFDSK